MLNVLEQLEMDITLWYQLLMDAEKQGNLALVEKLEIELFDMKAMAVFIEKPEIHRHLRIVGNEAWREFNEGGRR